MLTNLGALLSTTLRMATPLILASLGGMFSERSGVINIALEGIMLIGAFTAMVGSYYFSPWTGVLLAIIVGMLVALVHAIASISFRADQIVSATAINIFATGITGFLLRLVFGEAGQSPSVQDVGTWTIPIINKIPFLKTVLGNQIPFVYIALILVAVSYWVLFKTPFGLRIRSVGEHPAAADSVGINVIKMRYIAVIMSGFFAGLAGASLSIGLLDLFVKNMSSGRGFIALAAMIFGKWTPHGAMLAALLFGFADALQMLGQTLGLTFIPRQFLLMAPYIVTILALAGVVGRSTPPAADGEPYIKEEV
ncbi:MAG TPA: ABC transporter permease [Halanaerobiales bacterium]|nr:ABC transporter permease [Halanaerobiales bacterium]